RVVDMPSTFAAPAVCRAAAERRRADLRSPPRLVRCGDRRSRGAEPRARPPPRRVRALPRSATVGSVLRGEPRERQVARVAGRVPEGLLDAEQLVVLGHSLAAGGSAGLDLA